MARKTGQIIRRGPGTWFVRIYVGRDAETGKRKYNGKQIRGGLRDAQAHLRSLACEVHAIEAAGEVKALPNPRKTERKRPQPAKLRQL